MEECSEAKVYKSKLELWNSNVHVNADYFYSSAEIFETRYSCSLILLVTMYLYSSKLNLMFEIFNDTFAGKVKQGDTLEDFKMIAERNGITVCAPGTHVQVKYDITIIFI